MVERLVIYLAISEALQYETKETIEYKNQSYVDWCDISDKERNKKKVKITVTYDMVWQKISSGRIYESSSGHAFIVGGRSRGVIGMVLYSKA